MKARIQFVYALVLALASTQALADRPKDRVTIEDFACPQDGLHCVRVRGHSQGNHALDCTVIRPWARGDEPPALSHPVVAWANGWDQGNVNGQCTTNGYLPGLKSWALAGPYLVVAANQWSVQESDVLACLEWVVANERVANRYLTGLVGHSQGGGAVIKAGDGVKGGVEITASIAMTPYGPAWVDSGRQDGQVLILGGSDDTTTPPASFLSAWEQIEVAGGGVFAVLEGGTHNSDAWGTYDNGATMSCEDAAKVDFGRFQEAGRLWWDWHLNGNDAAGPALRDLLTTAPWNQPPWPTEFAPDGILPP